MINTETLLSNQKLLRTAAGKIDKWCATYDVLCRFAPINSKYPDIYKREPHFCLALSKDVNHIYYLYFNCGNYQDTDIAPFNKLALFTSITVVDGTNFDSGTPACHFHIKSITDVESLLAWLEKLIS